MNNDPPSPLPPICFGFSRADTYSIETGGFLPQWGSRTRRVSLSVCLRSSLNFVILSKPRRSLFIIYYTYFLSPVSPILSLSELNG